MLSLQNVNNGEMCKVTWMVGKYADMLRNEYDLKEDKTLKVLRNYNRGGVIVSCDGKHIAMTPEVSTAIKVENL